MNRLRKNIERIAVSAMRNFPWPVLNKCRTFPPIETSNGPVRLLVLTTPANYLEAIWTAYTFLFWNKGDFEVEIKVDGKPPSELHRICNSVLPGSKVSELGKNLDATTKHQFLSSFRTDFKFGVKLGAILESNGSKPLIYCDSDVLFFRRSDCIARWLKGPDSLESRYVTDKGSRYLSQYIAPVFSSANAEVPAGFNSGFFMIQKGFFDSSFLDHLLSVSRVYDHGQPFDGIKEGRLFQNGWEYFMEQWLVGASMHRAAGKALPEDLFLHTNDDMRPFSVRRVNYDRICMRHFFGTVRHRLYTDGMPMALSKMDLR